MKRSKPLHGAGTDALTPKFSDAEYTVLPEHTKRGAVLFFIESLQRRIAAQQEIIQNQQSYIDKMRRIFTEMGPLLPSATSRPAKSRL
jgi:hypothetical protein